MGTSPTRSAGASSWRRSTPGQPALWWRRRATGRRSTALAAWSTRRPWSWATTLVWGRVHKFATDTNVRATNLNSYLLESTLNFHRRNYAFSRLELVDKDELFPEAAVHPAYRIGA